MITSAITFALLSLLFAGFNDVLFKRYASQDRSRGAYVFGIGVVWGLLQLGYASIQGSDITLDSTSLMYGLAAGLVVTVSNLLLLESLTHIDASLGSTVYRLNTVGVVILALLFLNEDLDGLKALGIGLGVAAVALLYHPGGHGEARGSRFTVFFALVVLASLLRAVYGVLSKAGLNAGADLQTMLILAALCWIGGGYLYARLREKRFRLTRKKLLYASISGVLVFLIVNFLLLAIETGQASIVIPIANMSFVIALIVSVALGMERLNAAKLAAVAMAIGSIAVLASAP